jgi:hypothetical protein
MPYPTLEEFTTLIDRFVTGGMPATAFERLYMEMFKNDEGLHPDAQFAILDSLFGDVDAFTPEPALRNSGDLDEDQLRARATVALDALRGLCSGT